MVPDVANRAPDVEGTRHPRRRRLRAWGVGLGLASVSAACFVVALVTRDPTPAPELEEDGYTIEVGDSWAEVLRAVPAGATVVVSDGRHGHQVLRDLEPGVTLVGHSRSGAVVGGLTLVNARDLRIRSLTVEGEPTRSAVRLLGGSSNIELDELDIRPRANAGVDIFDQARDIAVRRSTIDASATQSPSGRGIRLFGGADPSTWVRDIAIENNDIGYAAGDLIFIAGATNVTISGNHIHDPQENDDHNDGVQSVGSESLDITGNTFAAAGAPGPDQAIMLGHAPGDSALRVKGSRITNNLIREWRGTGIILAGTVDTLVAHNSVVRLGTPEFRSASLSVGRPNGYRNEQLRVVNNVFDRILRTGGSIEVEDYNCVRVGGLGPHDIAADPRVADLDLLTLSPDSPCLDLGVEQATAVDRAGVRRGPRPDAGAWELSPG